MNVFLRTAPFALALAVVLAIATLAPVEAAKIKAKDFSVQLNGAAVTNAADATTEGDLDGKGKVTITLKTNGTSICWKYGKIKGLDLADDVSPFAAIFQGTSDEVGDAVLEIGLPNRKGNGSGCINDVDEVDEFLVQDIRDNPSTYYVAIVTDDFVEGAIRGQLR